MLLSKLLSMLKGDESLEGEYESAEAGQRSCMCVNAIVLARLEGKSVFTVEWVQPLYQSATERLSSQRLKMNYSDSKGVKM